VDRANLIGILVALVVGLIFGIMIGGAIWGNDGRDMFACGSTCSKTKVEADRSCARLDPTERVACLHEALTAQADCQSRCFQGGVQ
jgi:hypothetical protein